MSYEDVGVSVEGSQCFMPGFMFPDLDEEGNPVWNIKMISVTRAKILMREFQFAIEEAEKMNKPENLKEFMEENGYE